MRKEARVTRKPWREVQPHQAFLIRVAGFWTGLSILEHDTIKC